jgi:hypothetical protein
MWLRARWSALGIALYLLCLAIAAQLFPGIREPVLLAALLLTVAITHLIQVFTLGPADLGIRNSGFPRHTFVFPLATRSLVAWPMLIGTAAHAGLWVLVATLVFRPAGFETPVIWPAVLFGSTIAWAQAISWTPFSTPYARVPALALSTTPLFCLGVWAGLYLESGTVAIAVTAASFAWGTLAYVFAMRGLARARRGDGGNLGVVGERLEAALVGRNRVARPFAKRPFRSPAAAQLWHEWRRNGSFLPAMIAFIGVPMLALNCKVALDAQADRTLMIGSVSVSTPLLSLLMSVGVLLMLAATIGAGLGKLDLWGKEAMPSFFATRPMTTPHFIWIKFAAAAMSAFASTAILLVLLAAWAGVEISWLNPRESVVRGAVGVLTWRKAAITAVAIIGIVAITWRGIAIGLWPSLAGRKWISVVIGVFFTGAMTLAIIAGSWIYSHPEVHSDCLALLPWLLGVLVTVKACAAAGISHSLTKHRLIESRTLAFLLLGWAAGVAVIFAGVWCFVPLNWPVVAGAILLIPFSRLAIAPAALHWNRHR